MRAKRNDVQVFLVVVFLVGIWAVYKGFMWPCFWYRGN